MQLPSVTEIKGCRVLTSRQLAEAYGVTVKQINHNFERNKNRYTVGKHYISLSGKELKELKALRQIGANLKYAPVMNFWTERGALLHAKSLNTDRAWEVYDWLVDFYFRARDEQHGTATAQAPQKERELVLDMPGNKKMQEQVNIIKNQCISVMTLLEAQNRYLPAKKIDAIQNALTAVSFSLYLNIENLKSIQARTIEEPQ